MFNRCVGMDKDGNNIYSRETRRILFEKQQCLCGICGQPMKNNKTSNLDHIIPLSKGGRSIIENLQLAHVKCNSEKADKILTEAT